VVATLPPLLDAVRAWLLWDLALWPASLPTAMQVAIALLSVDIAYYWAHRISHHNPFLWQSHRIHHSPESIDWLMGWRVEWLNESIALTARYIPIVLLGVPAHVSALAVVIVNAHAMFPHANIDVRSGVAAPVQLIYEIDAGDGATVSVSVPDELGALVLKSAAHQSDSRDRERHLTDAAALAACITEHPAERARLAGSDRGRLTHLAKELADPSHAAWLVLPAPQRQAGQDTLRILTS
jgi:hypothetical protein